MCKNNNRINFFLIGLSFTHCVELEITWDTRKKEMTFQHFIHLISLSIIIRTVVCITTMISMRYEIGFKPNIYMAIIKEPAYN